MKNRYSFLVEHFRRYSKLIIIGLIALVLVDFLEIIPPFLIKRAVDHALEGQPDRQLIWISALILLVYAGQGVCRYAWRMYLVRASFLTGRDTRKKFSDHLFELSASFFDRRRIGELMSLATNDVDAIRAAVGPGLLTMADAIFILIWVPAAMFLLSPKLLLISLIPLPFVPWFVMKQEKKIHDRFEKVQDSFSAISAHCQENLGGIRVIKGFAREDAQIEILNRLSQNHQTRALYLARVNSTFGPTLDFTMSIGMILLLALGGSQVIEGHIGLGTFIAFQRYIQKLIWPMMAIGLSITHFQRAIASKERMQEILSCKTDTPEQNPPLLPKGFSKRAKGHIEFKNLNFTYPHSNKPVLKNFTLIVEPGERIAVVGPIGCGKSALLSLLPRLYPLPGGQLFLDEIDINHWPLDELRNQVGYVGQEVFLFSESVTDNVAYGFQNWQARPEDVDSIVGFTQLASVHEDIGELVQGYKTKLGERGVNLSGGQKQRLTIARALAKRPSILVLDDALSSVDVQTEEKILSGLRARSERNTEIVAAHRVSTVRDADRIIVLENGEMTQMGRHSELLKMKSGFYFRFYEQQRLKEDLEQYLAGL